MSGLKRWWNDETYKQELTAKADAGSWYVVAGDLPGLVIRIVYAGYKIRLPNSTEVIVNPDTLGASLRNVGIEEYVEAAAVWQAAEDKRLEAIQAAERARLAKLEAQRLCDHIKVETYRVVEAAGCDITDTYCCACEKILRRSWSTAYDRDPDDHVSDWTWWSKECTRLYKQAPNPANYVIVEQIADDYPDFLRQPRPDASYA